MVRRVLSIVVLAVSFSLGVASAESLDMNASGTICTKSGGKYD